MNIPGRKAHAGLEEADYVTIEYNPHNPAEYRLVRHQSRRGDGRATSTVLTQGDWDAPGGEVAA